MFSLELLEQIQKEIEENPEPEPSVAAEPSRVGMIFQNGPKNLQVGEHFQHFRVAEDGATGHFGGVWRVVDIGLCVRAGEADNRNNRIPIGDSIPVRVCHENGEV